MKYVIVNTRSQIQLFLHFNQCSKFTERERAIERERESYRERERESEWGEREREWGERERARVGRESKSGERERGGDEESNIGAKITSPISQPSGLGLGPISPQHLQQDQSQTGQALSFFKYL